MPPSEQAAAEQFQLPINFCSAWLRPPPSTYQYPEITKRAIRAFIVGLLFPDRAI
jgi:hypothetical protein